MKVGIIMGGVSEEREVSLKSGESMLKYIDKEKYEVIPIIIDKEIDILDKTKDIDFALLALHGKFGEDGRVQAVLETLNIPYSGSNSLSSILCMDKDLSKRILAISGILTAKWNIFRKGDDISSFKLCDIDYPVFVKPNSGGSSVATFKVANAIDLENAIREVLKYDDEVMIEEFIHGTEITCPVFNKEVFPILAIEPKAEFYDYTQKYSENGAEHFVINFEKKIQDEIEDVALKTFDALKCSVYARVDFILTSDGVPYVLEINTLPGMTATSLFPQSALEKGLTYPEFINKIIEVSLKKYQ